MRFKLFNALGLSFASVGLSLSFPALANDANLPPPPPPISGISQPPTMGPISSPYWRQTDESLHSLSKRGYRLITVLSPNNQSRSYYLQDAAGNIARCIEGLDLPSSLALGNTLKPPVPDITMTCYEATDRK